MERFFPVNGLLSGSLPLFKLLENNLVVIILIDLIDRFVDVRNNIINLEQIIITFMGNTLTECKVCFSCEGDQG